MSGQTSLSHTDFVYSVLKSDVVANAEYVDDKDLKLFIHTFHLHWSFAQSRPNTILVVPESKTLKKLVDDFNKILKKEDIDPSSVDASKFAAKLTEVPFKDYIVWPISKHNLNE